MQNMEGCGAVGNVVESVACELQFLLDESSEDLLQQQANLNDIISMLNGKSGEEELNDEELERISAIVKRALDCATRVSLQHRQQHVNISKVGKTIEKNFTRLDINSFFLGSIFKEEQDKKDLRMVIADHLYRVGKNKIGDQLCMESGIDPKFGQPIIELNEILKALESHNLEPIFKWVMKNREALEEHGSSLEFQLHCLTYLNLVKKNGSSLQTEAMMYGRAHFPRFAKFHEKEIQVMMGGLLYFRPDGMVLRPYANLFDGSLWDKMLQSFVVDASAVLEIPVFCPLDTTVSVGCMALPSALSTPHLTNLSVLTCQGQTQTPEGSSGWRNEMPVEIKLDGTGFQVHSNFCCPILRQQTTASNPPVRLNCGHVISRLAHQLLRDAPVPGPIKCPYCSREQNQDDAKEICF